MDEQRKYAILFAAATQAARRLSDPDVKPWPRAAAIRDAIDKAKRILEQIGERSPTERRSQPQR